MKYVGIISSSSLSLVAIATLAISGGLTAQQPAPVFTTIDFPGASSTQPWGINRRGDIIGLYISADSTHHGFLLSGGRFTSIDFPGASLTEAYGINAQGDIVGTYMTTGTVTHGFVLRDGWFTTIDFPDATYNGPAGINTRGEVEGLYTLAGVNHGFLLKGTDFTTVDFPGSTSSGLNGFNERGDLVGNYSAAGVTYGYVMRNGSFTPIDYPGAAFTGAYGINRSGDVAGRYRDAAGVTHAYLLSGSQFTSFDYPAATFTGADAIADTGDIVGRYTLNGVTHGFLVNEVQPRSYTITDLGPAGNPFSQASFVNNHGLMTGVDTAPDGTQHAVLWHQGQMLDISSPGLGGPNSAGGVVNESGVVVGGAETSSKDPNNENFCGYGTGLQCMAFLWQDGVFTPLPSLGGTNSDWGSINNRGEVAGYAENNTRDPDCRPGVAVNGTGPQVLDFEAVIWGPEPGEMRELPPLPGDKVGVAFWINDNGQAVGMSGLCSNTVLPGLAAGPHAVLWERNGSVHDLGNLGGTVNPDVLGVGTVAFGINNQGQVTGISALPGNQTTHPFLWTTETGMQDLGLPAGDFGAAGLGINSRGQVVGSSFSPPGLAGGNSRAVLWEKGAPPLDLNTVIPADSPLYLVAAFSINDSGEIAGFGATSSGDIHGFLATPGTVTGSSSAAPQTKRPTVLPESTPRLLRQGWPFGRIGGRVAGQR